MVDQKSRGGKKEATSKEPQGAKHQGVRPGSTGTKKERGNQQARQRVVPRKEDSENA
jgi:hypothetical protein